MMGRGWGFAVALPGRARRSFGLRSRAKEKRQAVSEEDTHIFFCRTPEKGPY
jgi:hypothetical protein